jgi:hypothetical protein
VDQGQWNDAIIARVGLSRVSHGDEDRPGFTCQVSGWLLAKLHDPITTT